MGYQKLGRSTAQRRALLRSLVTSLLANEKIETTEGRSKSVRSLAEKMITLGKQGDLAAKRQALAFLTDESVAKKLFDTVGPRYAQRQGGYTRVYKTGTRRGDAAPMVIIQLI
jgi:large subunit ribosomal protein L17